MTRTLHHAVSLFSNCGAGDVGYAKAGFQFDVMAEIDKRRMEVCLLNHPGAEEVVGDLRQTWPDVVKKYRRRVGGAAPALVAACPPCQGMSSARSDRGFENDPDAGTRDSRNLLVTVISQVAKSLRPKVVVVENVQAFLTRKIRHPTTEISTTAANFLIDELQDDYVVFPFLVDLCDYGVPQSRKRTFLTFIRKSVGGLKYLTSAALTPYPIPAYAPEFGGSPINLKAALSELHLPPLDASKASEATSGHGGGLLSVPVWLDRRYAMVAAIRKNSGKSAWQNTCCERCGKVKPSQLAASCPKCGGPLLRPVVKAKNGRYRLIHGFHSSTYSRIYPHAPCATITTASGHIGSNHTIHPFENRLLSAFECALLQTFPRRFKWGDALSRWGHTNVREMIGEAVPPLFTHLHGRTLVALLEGRRPWKLLSPTDSRCKRATKRLGLQLQKASK